MNGLGLEGKPRYGRPKTEEERRRSHFIRYGTYQLPQRGTGLSIIGSPNEKTIPVGYLILPERLYRERVIEVRPPGIVPPVEEKPPEEVIAEEKVDFGKYIPWIILGIILLGGGK